MMTTARFRAFDEVKLREFFCVDPVGLAPASVVATMTTRNSALGRVVCSAVILCLMLLSACYSLPEPDCGSSCQTGVACPDDYKCGSDHVCHRNGSSPGLTCDTGGVAFNVESVAARSTHLVDVTFDAVPDATQAIDVANYSIIGLPIQGAPILTGATVELKTHTQESRSYGLMVMNMTRAADGQPLTTATEWFVGRPAFDVASASSVDPHTATVVFSDTPDSTRASDPASYMFDGGLTVTGAPVVAGKTVTIATSTQEARLYTITVTSVRRASDLEPLDTNTAAFVGRTTFDVMSATPTKNNELQVTFSAEPDLGSATDVANYTFGGGLTAIGTPTLAGSTVTLTTSAQAAQTYTLTVSKVKRAFDGATLTTTTATFTGVTCGDTLLNGDETDIDCGGTVCGACANGLMCRTDADCQSNHCSGLTCGP